MYVRTLHTTTPNLNSLPDRKPDKTNYTQLMIDHECKYDSIPTYVLSYIFHTILFCLEVHVVMLI